MTTPWLRVHTPVPHDTLRGTVEPTHYLEPAHRDLGEKLDRLHQLQFDDLTDQQDMELLLSVLREANIPFVWQEGIGHALAGKMGICYPGFVHPFSVPAAWDEDVGVPVPAMTGTLASWYRLYVFTFWELIMLEALPSPQDSILGVGDFLHPGKIPYAVQTELMTQTGIRLFQACITY